MSEDKPDRWATLEYQEIGLAYRHDDTISMTAQGLFWPAAVAVEAYAWYAQAHLIPAMLASLFLFWIGFETARRMMANTDERLERARELEARLNMEHHRRLWDKRQEMQGTRIRDIRKRMFLAFATSWAVTLILALLDLGFHRSVGLFF